MPRRSLAQASNSSAPVPSCLVTTKATGVSPQRSDATPTTAQTVTGRALALIGAFDEQHRELRLMELARRAELSPATAHRLLRELSDWGALERRAGGEYVIGRRLWQLGVLATTTSGLREVASPFLHDVYAATLATVHLAVRDGTDALYLARLGRPIDASGFATHGRLIALGTESYAAVDAALASSPEGQAFAKLPLTEQDKRRNAAARTWWTGGAGSSRRAGPSAGERRQPGTEVDVVDDPFFPDS